MKGRRGIHQSFQQAYRGRNPHIRSQRLAFGHPGVDSETIIIGTNSVILDPALGEATVGYRVLIGNRIM